MMRKNVYLIVWLMTVILYSCYDDKGNYSYEDIDEISIAGMPDTLVTVFKNTDTLKVGDWVSVLPCEGAEGQLYIINEEVVKL